MADVSKLNINGIAYNIKDSTARTNANESAIAEISATYDQETETITFEL